MSPRARVRFVTHRCPQCGATMEAPPTAAIGHPCPKRKRGMARIQVFRIDAQPSDSKS